MMLKALVKIDRMKSKPSKICRTLHGSINDGSWGKVDFVDAALSWPQEL